jgi:hypothetical protein
MNTIAAGPGAVLDHPMRVERVVVMTITLMSTLIIYDGWETLQFLDVVAVIVGPVVAVFTSHVFSGAIAWRLDLGRTLHGDERVRLLIREARFLLIAVPPLVLLTTLSLFGVPYPRTIQVIILVGIGSLGFWGGVTGRRAGLSASGVAGCALCGLAIGGLTLVLQAILQPGQGAFTP